VAFFNKIISERLPLEAVSVTVPICLKPLLQNSLVEGCTVANRVSANEQVFAKAGNSLLVQPGTNAHLKICC
jgi:hypothetical protein